MRTVMCTALLCSTALRPRCAPQPLLTVADPPLRAVVVGGGPAGGAAALALHRLGWSVKVFEKRSDWEADSRSAWSVTLTKRAFDTLEALDVDCAELEGVQLEGQVIMGAAPGGKPISSPMQFRNINLSTQRIAKLLIRTAHERGIEVGFEHECLGVNQRRDDAPSCVRFLRSDGKLVEEEAELVVGADGANSAVRASLQRSAFGFEVVQDFEGSPQFRIATLATDGSTQRLAQGRPALDGVGEGGQLQAVGAALYTSFGADAGVILSPNIDGSVSIVATETLFADAPTPTPRDDGAAAVRAALEAKVPNVAAYVCGVPGACAALAAARPLAGKTVRCSSFAHGGVVLVGDAAHTMLNSLGQGANCALEDVSLLADALAPVAAPAAVAPALRGFSERRKRDADAAAALSKRAFTISPLLPRALNQLVYLLFYRAFQKLYALTRLPPLMPWQSAVNVDVGRPYAAIARAKIVQDAAGLAAVAALLAAAAKVAVAAAKVAIAAAGM